MRLRYRLQIDRLADILPHVDPIASILSPCLRNHIMTSTPLHCYVHNIARSMMEFVILNDSKSAVAGLVLHGLSQLVRAPLSFSRSFATRANGTYFKICSCEFEWGATKWSVHFYELKGREESNIIIILPHHHTYIIMTIVIILLLAVA